MIPAGDGVFGVALGLLAELDTAVQAAVTDREHLTVDAVEQQVFAAQAGRHRFAFDHLAAKQDRVPVIAKTQLGFDVAAPPPHTLQHGRIDQRFVVAFKGGTVAHASLQGSKLIK